MKALELIARVIMAAIWLVIAIGSVAVTCVIAVPAVFAGAVFGWSPMHHKGNVIDLAKRRQAKGAL